MKKIVSFRHFPYLHLLVGTATCLAVYQIILGKVAADETEAIHTAWKIFAGESIYGDFFQHHHPLFYYLLVPVIAMGGETVFTFLLAELLTAALFAGIVVTTYILCREIYGDWKISLLAVVLLLVFPWFITHGTQVRPDILQVLLGLLSFRYLVRWLDGRARKPLVLSALLLSLSFLALQKAVFLIFAVGLILLLQLFRSGDARMMMRDFLLYWGLFSLLPALYLIYLLMTGEFRNYIDFNWLVNMKFMDKYFVFQYFRDYKIVLSTMGFTLLFIAGCFVRSPENADAHRAVVLAGICLIASLFFIRAFNPQYLLMAPPFISIVAAAAARHFFSRAMTGLILPMLILLCSVYLLGDTQRGGAKRGNISLMRHVLQVSGPEDVYFGHVKWNLFRKDADPFFWFCFHPKGCLETLQSFREHDWDPVRLIVQTRPKAIGVEVGPVWKEWYDSLMKHPAIAPHYERTPGYGLLYTRKEASSQ